MTLNGVTLRYYADRFQRDQRNLREIISSYPYSWDKNVAPKEFLVLWQYITYGARLGPVTKTDLFALRFM